MLLAGKIFRYVPQAGNDRIPEKRVLMGWSTTSDLERFAAAAGGYLRSRAAENTLLLSAAQDAQRHQAHEAHQAHVAQQQGTGSLFGWWTPPDEEDPRGAFVHDPAEPLLISGRAPEMATALAATLAKLGRQVRGVDAPIEAADAFAAAWSQRGGMSVRAHRSCRVYRLTASPQGRPVQGTPPPGLAGHPTRPAGSASRRPRTTRRSPTGSGAPRSRGPSGFPRRPTWPPTC